MRYLAIDYGLKRLGLAICDAEEIIVSPLCQLINRLDSPAKTVEKLKTIIEEHQVQALVLGLPTALEQNPWLDRQTILASRQSRVAIRDRQRIQVISTFTNSDCPARQSTGRSQPLQR